MAVTVAFGAVPTPTKSPILRLAAVLTAVTVAAAACGGDDPARTDGAASIDAPVVDRPDGSLDWDDCVDDDDADGYECATLDVPLDWSRPDGDRIDIAVARRRAAGRRVGTLVSNPGGPGASGIDHLFAEPFGAALTERFDLVSFDPRGVGRSTSFDCDRHVEDFLDHDPDPDDAAEQAALERDAARISAQCGRRNPGLAANVGTDDVARDLDALRVALGEERLSYIGFSYGTLLGLRYLDLFGDRVRAMVLDGVVDPTETFEEWLSGQAVAFDAALDRALDACGTLTDAEGATIPCPLDDPQADFDRAQALVDRRPVPVRDDPATTVGPAEFVTGAIFAGYGPELWASLHESIAGVLDGDGTDMDALAAGYYDLGGFTAYAAVECLDSVRPVGVEEYRAFAARLDAASPRLGATVANELAVCATWPAPVRSITGPVDGADGPPILVVGNRGDPATPYRQAVEVASMLHDGRLVSYDGEGHTSYGRDACVDDAVEHYLVGLVAPVTDPDC